MCYASCPRGDSTPRIGASQSSQPGRVGGLAVETEKQMEKQGNIAVPAYVAGFKRIAHDKSVVAKILGHILKGDAGQRSLDEMRDEIALAANCVEVHFGLDPVKVGIPLVTLHVLNLQLGDELGGELDEDDADALLGYAKQQSHAFMTAQSIPADMQDLVWQFTVDQAIAVLRGEFRDDEEASVSSDEADAFDDLLSEIGLDPADFPRTRQ